MASQFGGVPINKPISKFGGVPVTEHVQMVIEEPKIEQGGVIDAVVEPALAIGSGIVGEAASGITGLGALTEGMNLDESIQLMEGIKQDISIQPKTEAGKKGLETVNDLLKSGMDILNVPLSNLGGLLEFIQGQGIDQSLETIKNIRLSGVSKPLSERVFEETGSPAAAAIAETVPTALGVLTGTKGLKPVATATGKAVKPIARQVLDIQSPSKQALARRVEAGEVGADIAGLKLDKPTTDVGGIGKSLGFDQPKVKPDFVANEAMKQGFDPGRVSVFKSASNADKGKMREMINIAEKGKNNPLFQIDNRASDVAGNTLMEKFRSIRKANLQAGRELDGIVKSLKGDVDFNPAVGSFVDDLESMGITFNKKLEPQFKGSDIEGLKPNENLIKRVIQRMKIDKTPTPQDVHKLKRFLDEQVSYGKSAKGLTGNTETVLKRLRHNLDAALDNKFPEYDKVNTTYAETINAINSLQDIAGRKMDLTRGSSDASIGTLLRRITSQAQSRGRLLDSIKDIESISAKHSGTGLKQLTGEGLGGESLKTQLLFVNELERVFGSPADTSYLGQSAQAVKGGANEAARVALGQKTATGALLEVGESAIEKMKGINEPNAFKAMRELLQDAN